MLAHLLQSTLCAAAVWLATLALRHNHARARHALWMAASLKFLIPFSLFVTLGSQAIPHARVAAPPPQMRFVIADAAPAVTFSAATAPAPRDWRTPLFLLLWIAGAIAVLIRWYARWRTAARRLADSVPCHSLALPVPVRTSPSIVEPGIYGIFRPVLVLPAGIEQRLSTQQLHAVLAHELCHVRHRDNLAAALHMLVESIFWFHPLVWWMGARLVDERERACDEEVLQLGSDRAVYAESILRVCQFCLESPVPCVSGITGADLKQRIRDIMTASARRRLEPGKKLLLAVLAAAAIAIPLAIGLTHPPQLRAQTAAPLRFDVASVKVSPQHFAVIFPERSGGRIKWNTDLWTILTYAYRLQAWRISGPVPARDQIFAIDVTTDPNATDDQVRLMFQSLLIDRFHMQVHRETKDVDGYALSVGKSGLKLLPAKDGEIPPLPEWFHGQDDTAVLEGKVVATMQSATVSAITGRRATMLQLANSLQSVLKSAVLDQTTLTGKYYFAIQFAPDNHPDDADLPDLIGAIQQLGLKLEKHKGAVELLVVDRIDKLPTEN